MKKSIIVSFLSRLNGMIATFEQAGLMDDHTEKEKKACELLKAVRLLLDEDLEELDERKK